MILTQQTGGGSLRERGCEKPFVPEHDTINAHTPVLPTRAAAHALERARRADLRARIKARLSRAIESHLDQVDRCIAILDALTLDPDIEADNTLFHAHPYGSGCIGISSDDEPSLCGVGTHPGGSEDLEQGYPIMGGRFGDSPEDLEQHDANDEQSAAEWTGRGVHRFSLGGAA